MIDSDSERSGESLIGSQKKSVFLAKGWDGCSDGDVVHAVFSSREVADAYVSNRNLAEPEYSYEVEEIEMDLEFEMLPPKAPRPPSTGWHFQVVKPTVVSAGAEGYKFIGDAAEPDKCS